MQVSLQVSSKRARHKKLVKGRSFCLYGDPTYPLRPLLLKPYGGPSPTAKWCAFNKKISTARQAVEWGFGKIAGLFAFLDFRKVRSCTGKMFHGCTRLGYPRELSHMHVWFTGLAIFWSWTCASGGLFESVSLTLFLQLTQWKHFI